MSKTPENYIEYPDWKECIRKWNKACDIMGIRQCLWVLRFELKFRGSLAHLHPDKFKTLLNLCRRRYAELRSSGKIKDSVGT